MLKSRGFTLIELLVTISIIAILSAIGLVVYSNVMKQGRDSKRQSDLRSIQSALEQYYSDQGFYPYAVFSFGSSNPGFNSVLVAGGAFTNATGYPANPSTTVTKTYMNSLPKDPQASAVTYNYRSLPSSCFFTYDSVIKCTSYCLFTRLENSSSPIPSPPPGCDPYPAGGYNFAVTPPP